MKITESRKTRLVQLGEVFAKLIGIAYWSLWVRHHYRRMPAIMRLAVWHAPLTFLTLALFPPAPAVPPIAIPIVAAAGFCAAYALSALTVIKI